MKTRQQIRNIYEAIYRRCYKKDDKTYPMYGGIGVTICDEWLIFENFYKWYKENYYSVNDEVMCIDKDILDKHNLTYCPEKCLIVPFRINNMFVGMKIKANGIPSGITKVNGRYRVQISGNDRRLNGKYTYLGTYDNLVHAAKVAKIFKMGVILEVAREYENKIPKHVYHALLDFEI